MRLLLKYEIFHIEVLKNQLGFIGSAIPAQLWYTKDIFPETFFCFALENEHIEKKWETVPGTQ